MIATVSGTQYDLCSGSTSLATVATPMQAIIRIVNVQATQPPRSRSQARAAQVCSRDSGGPVANVTFRGVQFPDMTRDNPTIDSRSATAPGDPDHCGGMS